MPFRPLLRSCQYNSIDMSILKVARMGHPVLREKARPLEKSEIRSPIIQKLIDEGVSANESWSDYLELVVSSALLRGNAITAIETADNGRLTALRPNRNRWPSSIPRSPSSAARRSKTGRGA